MKKILSFLLLGLICSIGNLWAATESSGNAGANNTTLTGTSYSLDGKFIAGKGGVKQGNMPDKGVKLRSNQGNLVFAVSDGYKITGFSFYGCGNTTTAVVVESATVDGGSNLLASGVTMPAKGASASGDIILSDIEAEDNITLTFAEGSEAQIVGTWSITYVQTAVVTQEISAVTLNGAAISEYDLATLKSTNALTIDGSELNGLGGINVTLSSGATTVNKEFSENNVVYSFSLNSGADAYEITVSNVVRNYAAAQGTVVYYDSEALSDDSKTLTIDGVAFNYASKTFGSANNTAGVTLGSTTYKPIKLSTGEGVSVTFPTGKVATKIIVYGWSADGTGYMKTFKDGVDGENSIATSDNKFYATDAEEYIYPSVYEYAVSNWEALYFECAGGQPFVVVDFVLADATPAQTYSVTYKANGGTGDDIVAEASTIAANSFTAPDGKQFKEWNTAADGTGTSYAVGAAVTEALTLFAIWEDVPVVVVGLSFNEPEDLPEAYTYSPSNTPVIAVVSGINAVNVADGGGSTAPSFSVNNSEAPTGGKRWMAFKPETNGTMALKVQKSNDSRTFYLLNKDHATTSDYVSSFSPSSKNAWDEGWEFEVEADTWYALISSGSNFYIASVVFTPSATYTVTYKANGSGEEDVVESVNKVGANPFTYENHKFTGWNTSADGMGTPYAVGAPVSEELELYAQWQAAYTVSYYDGETLLGTEEVIAGEAPTAAEISTDKDFYSFAGWFANAELTGDAVVLAEQSISAAISYYGKWNAGSTITLEMVWTTSANRCDGTKPAAVVNSTADAIAPYLTISFSNVDGGTAGAEGGSLNSGKVVGNEIIIAAKAGYAFNALQFFGKIEDADCEYSIDGGDWTTLTSTNQGGNACYEVFADQEVHVLAIRNTGAAGVWIRNMQVEVKLSASNFAVYERDVTAGNFGTICLPYAVSANAHQNLVMYNIAGKRVVNEVVTSIVLVEEEGALVAGRPYIFEAAGDNAAIIYNVAGAAVAGSNNGLVGTLEAIDVDAPYYLLSNNAIVNAVAGSSLVANRAYIDLAAVPEAAAAVPGRVVEISLGENNATAIDNIEGADDAVKFVENGVLYIRRAGVVYTTTGQVVR